MSTVTGALALPASAGAAPAPGAYGDNDAGGFFNILPPGQGQSVNALEIGAFLSSEARPPADGAGPGCQMYWTSFTRRRA